MESVDFRSIFIFQNLLSAKELRLEHVLHGLPLKVGKARGVAEAFRKRVAVDLQLGDLYKMLALVLSYNNSISFLNRHTWNLSNILHGQIFGPKILHTKKRVNCDFFANNKTA